MKLLVENFSVDKADVQNIVLSVPSFMTRQLSLTEIIKQTKDNLLKNLTKQCDDISVVETKECVLFLSKFGAVRVTPYNEENAA